MSAGVPFGPAARITVVKGSLDEQPKRDSVQHKSTPLPPSSPPRHVLRPIEQKHDLRPSTGNSLASVSTSASGPPDLLDDYYRSTEAFIDYLVQMLTNADDLRLPSHVDSIAGIQPKPHLQACDATCREWLAHHRLVYATPGHSSHAIISGRWR